MCITCSSWLTIFIYVQQDTRTANQHDSCIYKILKLWWNACGSILSEVGILKRAWYSGTSIIYSTTVKGKSEWASKHVLNFLNFFLLK